MSLLYQDMMLKASEDAKVPWAALRYLIGEVVYGGHTNDPWDQRCLVAILQRCYNPRVLEEGHNYCQAQVPVPLSPQPHMLGISTRNLPHARNISI